MEETEPFGKLVLLVRSDDGIVVYLNGNEIVRNNLSDGNIEYLSTAIEFLDGLDERLYRRFVVPASSLVLRVNTIAVEVHQANSQSSDLFLGLVLLRIDLTKIYARRFYRMQKSRRLNIMQSTTSRRIRRFSTGTWMAVEE